MSTKPKAKQLDLGDIFADIYNKIILENNYTVVVDNDGNIVVKE